jgi:hypothetical protein
MALSGSANITEHKLIGRKALAEFAGSDAEKISLNITLSADLGSDVEGEINKIKAHTERGTQLPLVIGRSLYGNFRWLINGYNINITEHDIRGVPIFAVVTLKLIEYLRN